jgi:hypothetical protein
LHAHFLVKVLEANLKSNTTRQALCLQVNLTRKMRHSGLNCVSQKTCWNPDPQCLRTRIKATAEVISQDQVILGHSKPLIWHNGVLVRRDWEQTHMGDGQGEASRQNDCRIRTKTEVQSRF